MNSDGHLGRMRNQPSVLTSRVAQQFVGEDDVDPDVPGDESQVENHGSSRGPQDGGLQVRVLCLTDLV